MKEKFLRSLNTIYNEIIDNSSNISRDDFNFVKRFIYDNRNDKDVIVIKNWI